MNENSIFFAVDKIEDKFIEEAAESAMEENSVQPIFITPTQKKTKKLIFAIASIAACFALIFGVGIAVGRNSGIEITQTLSPLNTAATSAEATTTEAAETEPESTRQEDNVLTDQYGNKYTLYDRPMPEELLKDFDYEQHYLAVASNNPDAGEFFDSLDIPEKETLKELFYRGVTLGKGFSDPNWLTAELRVGAPAASINNIYNNIYLETGIKYDSFYNSLLDVFEEDVVKTALKKAETIICPISYNNEIWMVLTDGLSRDILVKHMEYRLVKFTDTELIFETILYKTEKATLNTEAYDPQHPEKYQTETVENIFVKTENGWRIRALYTPYGYISAEAAATNSHETTPTQTTEENHHLMRPDNTKIDLFSSAITDMQGKEYEINVYMYYVDNGEATAFPIEEGMLRGYVAAELLYNGEKIYDREIVVGNVGQTGKKYYLPKIGDYFKVLHLDGGDIFVCSYSNDDKLWITQFYVIIDGELKAMERYFSDEERKQIEEKTTGKGIVPSKAKYEFITPNIFITDKNRIIYKLEFETSGMSAYSYEIGSYFPGEIPLIFDFENNTVRCEKEEYAGLVYSYFDVD